MEALLRWNNYELGSISPVEFIPIAEDSGLIIPIGDWVMFEAQNQIKKWNDSGYNNLKISINVSTKQFKQKNFVEKIYKIINDFQINPEFIEIEITESSMMENPEDAISKMKLLHNKGIQFSIDDFGTGYSSLSYIKKFPINKIKIDQSFIKDVLTDLDNKEITKAIIAMSHNLELKVLAEGVETKEQMNFLKDLNCDEMQGYYFSRPINSESFSKLLSGNQNY
jgi:diguanylate cyclase